MLILKICVAYLKFNFNVMPYGLFAKSGNSAERYYWVLIDQQLAKVKENRKF